ncbi:MAG: phosphate signaling complex protein PhoU [Planctomycetota bacterium]|jgi:phosphate transport system protein
MAIDLPTELVSLRRSILAMGASVEQRVGRIVESMQCGDIQLARSVRIADDEIDEMEVDIESECLRILALTQPVAGDLRFVLTVLRINSELERIADGAKGIAKRIIDLERLGAVVVPPESLLEMARCAHRMLGDAIAALADENAVLCRRIKNEDKRVDALQKEIFAWAQTTIPEDVGVTSAAIDILSIASKLERMGDLAENIAEDVVFLIDGSLVRHTNW